MNDSDYYGSGSLETTFACERARLVRLCAKFTGEGDVAEDLAQETLFEAWHHIHNLRSQDRLPQWLSGIAHNVCLRWARKRGRDLLQLTEPLHDPDASQTDLEDALVDDFDLEIELALAIVATMLGPTPARVAPVQAGPYPLTVSLYTDPANAGYALPFAIAPQQQQCGVLTFDLTYYRSYESLCVTDGRQRKYLK